MVKTWSRNTPESSPNETLVLHRVVHPSSFCSSVRGRDPHLDHPRRDCVRAEGSGFRVQGVYPPRAILTRPIHEQNNSHTGGLISTLFVERSTNKQLTAKQGSQRRTKHRLFHDQNIDSCITQLKAQEPSRTCNESNEEKKTGFAATDKTGKLPLQNDPRRENLD